MQAKFIRTEDAGENAQRARINADYRNREMRGNYKPTERSRVQQAVDAIDTAFVYHDLFVNYRKRFAAIKVVGMHARDREWARAVEESFEQRGYTKVVSQQGVIFRIPR